jgi:uncharacterized protein YjiS (DUF1127 family)
MEAVMLHIATTAQGHTSLFEQVRGLFNAYIEARRARAEQRLARQTFLRLADLDDRTLDDIGVSRAEVYTAAELPLEMNASAALREMATERRSRHTLRRAA